MIFEMVKYTRFNERITYIESNGTKYYKPIKSWDGINPLHTILMDCLLLLSKGYNKKCLNVLNKINKRTITIMITYLEDLTKRMKKPKKKYLLSNKSTIFVNRKSYDFVLSLLELCKGL